MRRLAVYGCRGLPWSLPRMLRGCGASPLDQDRNPSLPDPAGSSPGLYTQSTLLANHPAGNGALEPGLGRPDPTGLGPEVPLATVKGLRVSLAFPSPACACGPLAYSTPRPGSHSRTKQLSWLLPWALGHLASHRRRLWPALAIVPPPLERNGCGTAGAL